MKEIIRSKAIAYIGAFLLCMFMVIFIAFPAKAADYNADTNTVTIEAGDTGVITKVNLVDYLNDVQLPLASATFTQSDSPKLDAMVDTNGDFIYYRATAAGEKDFTATLTDANGVDHQIKIHTMEVNDPAGLVRYNTWVSGVQVMSSNMNNVLGDGTVAYVPATESGCAKLQLTDATIEGRAYIYSPYEGAFAPGISVNETLNLQLSGTSFINATKPESNVAAAAGAAYNNDAGIFVGVVSGGNEVGALTISGSGSLKISNKTSFYIADSGVVQLSGNVYTHYIDDQSGEGWIYHNGILEASVGDSYTTPLRGGAVYKGDSLSFDQFHCYFSQNSDGKDALETVIANEDGYSKAFVDSYYKYLLVAPDSNVIDNITINYSEPVIDGKMSVPTVPSGSNYYIDSYAWASIAENGTVLSTTSSTSSSFRSGCMYQLLVSVKAKDGYYIDGHCCKTVLDGDSTKRIYNTVSNYISLNNINTTANNIGYIEKGYASVTVSDIKDIATGYFINCMMAYDVNRDGGFIEYNGTETGKPSYAPKLEGSTTVLASENYTVIWPDDYQSVGDKTVSFTGNASKGYCGTLTVNYKVYEREVLKVNLPEIFAGHKPGNILDYDNSKYEIFYYVMNPDNEKEYWFDDYFSKLYDDAIKASGASSIKEFFINQGLTWIEEYQEGSRYMYNIVIKMKDGTSCQNPVMLEYAPGKQQKMMPTIKDDNGVYSLSYDGSDAFLYVAAQHTHGTSTQVVCKATTAADGYKYYTCSTCSDKYSNSTLTNQITDLSQVKINKIKSVTLSETEYVYDGTNKLPSVVVKDSAGKVIASKYYTLSTTTGYKDIGEHSIKVTFKTYYSGSKTLKYTILPAKVTSLKAENTSDGIKVTWSASETADGYYLYRKQDNGSLTRIRTTTKLSYTDPDATESGVKYQYRVYPYKKVDGVVYKGAGSGYRIIYRLKSPTISSASNSSSGISVKWTAVTGATGYYVYRSDDAGKTFSKIKTTTANSYVDTTANVNAKKYQYKIVAYKTVDETNYKSGESAVKSTFFMTRPTISSLTSTTANKAVVKWGAVEKASGYVVSYSLDADFASSKTITVSGGTTVNKTISGLTSGKKYYVKVRCYYETPSGNRYYSQWSTSKYIKVK